MGSVATWHTFQYCLDYFRYFMPMSGSLTADGDFMDQIVKDAGYEPDEFFLYAMSGTEDFAYSSFARQIEAMLEVPEGSFTEADREEEGNLAFRVQEGGTHTGAPVSDNGFPMHRRSSRRCSRPLQRERISYVSA